MSVSTGKGGSEIRAGNQFDPRRNVGPFGDIRTTMFIEPLSPRAALSNGEFSGSSIMIEQAMNQQTGHPAIGGGLLVVAQWEAKAEEVDRVAEILRGFLPQAQREPGVKLFLISRAKDNPAQFLFYELFGDEDAFRAHQESAHFKSYIAEQALPLLTRRERAQYTLL
ncbi:MULTISPECIES: antibiotic biosynthesis monooxygenase family protein [unclassified Bradyrhizobium]|uniref:putative quinol monooxygenase n=1 Tax=unclassified Bradyrhizobium TaxID=2631580 RepID=UPI001CD7460B|nr:MULTISPECIES: antibiotic biosynthesis monooxygenase family protein [unclassified Bradyrhizobium]